MPTSVHSRLRRSPRADAGWLQQLQMESLGKSRRVDGALSSPFRRGPLVWGGVGTDAQHTFLQLLRQGTARTAVDIICVETRTTAIVENHRVLVANARAQVEALVAVDADSLAANAVSLIAVDRLTPERLGSLMALYEHKVVMEAALLGINAFDQPGVELPRRGAENRAAMNHIPHRACHWRCGLHRFAHDGRAAGSRFRCHLPRQLQQQLARGGQARREDRACARDASQRRCARPGGAGARIQSTDRMLSCTSRR